MIKRWERRFVTPRATKGFERQTVALTVRQWNKKGKVTAQAPSFNSCRRFRLVLGSATAQAEERCVETDAY
uniref:Uncharacterized protein n=1 Tax=Neospora caninum (strain Liverpool) TaxID=572307 RepID=A0A0F7U484_NEOCL|nr:TPA: hypothetical protein BN1204_004625 [Neospora caninum Liverpool]